MAKLPGTHPDQREQPLVRPVTGWAIGLTVAALVLYLFSRSASLDDFDSYSFVMALQAFDLHLQQPQPPGFPVFVLLGRVLNLATQNPRVALTTLSAVGGAASVGLLAWLGTRLFERRIVGMFAAMLLTLLPIHWLTAGKALSDAVGLAFSLAAVALLVGATEIGGGERDSSLLMAGAFVLGLSLGVRPQSNLPGLLLAGWAAYEYVRAGELRTLGMAVVVGLAAMLLWLIPVVLSSGGPAEYVAMLQAHSEHVATSDSLFGEPLTATRVRARALDFAETVTLPTLGISVYAPLNGGDILKASSWALFAGVGLALAPWRRRSTQLVGVWLAVTLIPTLLTVSPYRMRLLLPVLPPLLLLIVAGWSRVGLLRWPILAMAVVGMTMEGAPLARTLATEPAPPTQAITFIESRTSRNDTLVAAAGSYRAAQVEMPGYPLLYRYQWDSSTAREAAASHRYTHIAVLDRGAFGDVIDDLTGDGSYVTLVDRTFTRDRRVHFQHSTLRAQILVLSSELTPAQLAPPDDGVIDIGGADDGRYLGEGWFRSETISGTNARWAGGDTRSTLRVSLAPDNYAISMRVLSYPKTNQTLTVYLNGKPVGAYELGPDWQEIRVEVGPGALTEGDVAEITLTHGRLQAPYAVTEGASSDRRQLTAAYDWIHIEKR